MKTKPLTFLLALTLLFLFSGSVYGDDLKDAIDAADRGDFKTAYKLWLPLAEQGHAHAQFNLGNMYLNGVGVPQDYALAHMWWNICGSSGDEGCVKNRNLVENDMSPQQIEKAQEMARNWKPGVKKKGIFEQLREVWNKVTK